jgi:RepB DNA-primase from phage plasmid
LASGSPGSHHAYWLLDEPIPIETLEGVNRQLAARLGADEHATDASRILRLPGTLNHKTDPATEVTLQRLTGERYPLERLTAALAISKAVVPLPLPSFVGAVTPLNPVDPSEPVANVLARLDAARRGTSGWTARCPAHDDERPSLSIGQGDDGRCLLKCHAGCAADAIVAAIGLRVSDLFPDRGTSSGRARDQLLVLTEHEQVELFHDLAGRPYAKITVADHREAWSLDSTTFTRWLQHAYYRHHSTAVAPDAVREAIAHLSAQAVFDAPERVVHRRVGGDLDRIWVDLGDDTWTVAEIRNDGSWSLREGAPVEFIREPGMQALPHPVSGGSIDLLRPLVNIPDDRLWTLYRGALIASYHPTGPYFVLFLYGSAGSGKTVAGRRFAQIVDPQVPFLTGTSTEKVAASKCRLLPIDNMSRLTRGWSDFLCVNSTGAGDRRRQLYTDDALFALAFKGPALITSLVLLATRGDLIDRLVPIGFERITDEDRQSETTLDETFAQVAPAVLGGLFGAVAAALRHGPETELPFLPRMADATLFVSASETGLAVPTGTFADTLVTAQRQALSDTIESSPFIEATVRFMLDRPEWQGTATRLLEEAAKLVDQGSRTPGWPANPAVASALLSEYELPLRAHGVTVQRHRTAGGNRDRFLVLRNDTARDAGRGTARDGRNGHGGALTVEAAGARTPLPPERPCPQLRGDARPAFFG